VLLCGLVARMLEKELHHLSRRVGALGSGVRAGKAPTRAGLHEARNGPMRGNNRTVGKKEEGRGC
jgi:hypothetical protein